MFYWSITLVHCLIKMMKIDFNKYIVAIKARDYNLNAIRRTRKSLSSSFDSFRINSTGIKTLGLNHSSLLESHVGYILPGAFISYVVLQVLMGVNHYSSTPICNANVTLSPFAGTSVSAAAGCMILNFILHLAKIIGLSQAKKRNYSLIKLIMMLAMISFISGSSLTLSFNWHYGGICCDSFG